MRLTMKQDKNVILLINLGSPDSLEVSSIREFLRRFLSDRRVVNLPKILWYPILYGFILSMRPQRLLSKYKCVWMDDGSPLIHYTRLQAEKLNRLLSTHDDSVIVKYAFSYSTPQINIVLDALHREYTVKKLTVIPLYPQFSSTTTMAVFDSITKFYTNKLYLPQLLYISSFCHNQAYIKALAKSILNSWQNNGRHEKLVFSYHGLPTKLIQDGDAYFDQCAATTMGVVNELGISSDEYIMAFQSKFGNQKWLLPATNSVLLDLAKQGIKSVDIICPGFVSECLETLEEIAIALQENYIHAGGEVYNYIPCLNDDDNFIQVLRELSEK